MKIPDSPPLMEAHDLTRHYQVGNNNIAALNRVSITISNGDFWAITGPSGSGKSTLLYLLGGMDVPSSGDIIFAGQSLNQCSKKTLAGIRNGSFGFVFQTPHVLFDRTVLENVLLPARYSVQKKPGTLNVRAQELLEYAGIENLAQRMPNTLSGGELQRVVFARALVCDPQIIFADEPTGSLDEDNSTKLIELLEDQANRNRAVIMVTHDTQAIPDRARRLSLQKARNGVVPEEQRFDEPSPV